MEVQLQVNQNFEDSKFFPSSFQHASIVDETQLFNSLPEDIYPSLSPKNEVDMQKIEEILPQQLYSSFITNRTVNSSSIESSSSSSSPTKTTTNNSLNLLIKAIFRDNKPSLISQATSQTLDRATASRLLHICCEFDSSDCASAFLNGEVCGVVPIVNELDSSTGYSPLHTAAENHAVRCIELLTRKRGRTDLRTKKVVNGGSGSENGNGGVLKSVLPLELSLRCVRMEIKWGPDQPLDDLLLILTEKDLRAIGVLSEKTKEIGEVAHTIAMEGRVAALTALLMVAADKVIDSVLEVRNHSEFSAVKTTVYNCVIKEAISIFCLIHDKQNGVEKNDHVYHGPRTKERRALLLREIELFHFFGASHTNITGSMGKKVVSPLILACQAGDEAVMNLLLKTDIDVNDVDAEGNSALHWCLKSSKVSNPEQIRVLRLLLKHGARLRQKDKWGLTAVHIAAGNGNIEALKILLSKDPESVHVTSELKETPLFLAVKNDQVECVQLLLLFGAKTEIHNLRRERPIELSKSQQMRSALNRTSVVITTRDSQQKYKLQNDEVVSTQEVLPKETYSSCESVNSNSDGDICKYFLSSSGCARGSNCFYKHGEEELCNKKSRSKVVRSIAFQEFKRKIFIGGLPVTIDSESLASVIQEKFGPVVDAKVLEMDMDGQIMNRGFGFVTFKDDKSVTDALEAHYTEIWGKKVEMKTAVPKCLLSGDESEDEPLKQESTKETVQETTQQKTTQLPRQELIQTSPRNIDNKQDTWANRIAKAKSDESVNERKARRLPLKDMPKWFQTFKKWLPNFLRKMSKNSKQGEYYSLSSVKTDFKALFGLNLDHNALGYPKLSGFIKSYPELCTVKIINTGGVVANHMILLPPKVRPPPLVVTKAYFPALRPSSDSKDVDVAKSYGSADLAKSHDRGSKTPTVSKDSDVAKEASNKETLSSTPNTTVSKKVAVEAVASVKASTFTDKVSVPINPRLLQFLSPDPVFLGRTWRSNGGFKAALDDHFRPKHLVLEHLAEKKQEVFFLRSIQFYDDYAGSINRGTCFGCGDNRLVWANYPCRHLLWCSDCKFKVQSIAEVGSPNHKCVVCDHIVEKIDLIRWSELQFHNYHDMEFPPVQAAYCLGSQKLRA